MRDRREAVDRELRALAKLGGPPILVRPLTHSVSSGGKRLRALLTLLSCEAVGGGARRAMRAAVAVECLHNFTLIHDDVMDDSPVRRGRPTVHAEWNGNVAILAGDQLIALGYHHLLGGANGAEKGVLKIFTRAFREVCEGQGYDMDFETRKRVTMRQYRMMIDRKTARVIAAAAEIGATVGGGSRSEVVSLRRYGAALGMAFQIRDDVLDVTGKAGTFGKRIGGDIARGKKTYLLVRALADARGDDRRLLARVASGGYSGRIPVGKVRSAYFRTGAVDAAGLEVGRLTRMARGALAPLRNCVAKDALLEIAGRLADRSV